MDSGNRASNDRLSLIYGFAVLLLAFLTGVMVTVEVVHYYRISTSVSAMKLEKSGDTLLEDLCRYHCFIDGNGGDDNLDENIVKNTQCKDFLENPEMCEFVCSPTDEARSEIKTLVNNNVSFTMTNESNYLGQGNNSTEANYSAPIVTYNVLNTSFTNATCQFLVPVCPLSAEIRDTLDSFLSIETFTSLWQRGNATFSDICMRPDHETNFEKCITGKSRWYFSAVHALVISKGTMQSGKYSDNEAEAPGPNPNATEITNSHAIYVTTNNTYMEVLKQYIPNIDPSQVYITKDNGTENSAQSQRLKRKYEKGNIDQFADTIVSNTVRQVLETGNGTLKISDFSREIFRFGSKFAFDAKDGWLIGIDTFSRQKAVNYFNNTGSYTVSFQLESPKLKFGYKTLEVEAFNTNVCTHAECTAHRITLSITLLIPKDGGNECHPTVKHIAVTDIKDIKIDVNGFGRLTLQVWKISPKIMLDFKALVMNDLSNNLKSFMDTVTTSILCDDYLDMFQ